MAERQSYFSGKTISREQVARLLAQAGFSGDAIWRLIAIAGRESHYDPGAHGTDQDRAKLTGDRGLWQINSVHDQALKNAGIIKQASDLFDPLTNARAAYFLSNGGADLSPWNAGPGGWTADGDPLFGTDPMAAQAAYNRVSDNLPAARGAPTGPQSMADIAEGLGNLGAPGYKQYATDPRRQITSRQQAIMAALGGGVGPGFPDVEQFNWQEHPELNDQYNQLSPHLQMFERWTMKNYGGTNAGDYVERPITGGGPPSSHAFGAAFDWKPTSRDEGLSLVQKVIENPSAFGIQAVHDYEGGRIWHADRAAEGGSVEAGWKPYDFPPGDASDTHFHFEVDRDSWDRVGRDNWRAMNQAQRGTYNEDGVTLTPEQFANVARRKGNRGNPLFEDYATLNARQLAQRQARWGATHYGGPGQTEGPPSQALGNLLDKLGVDYPTEDITPTPALLAYLAGVNLSLSDAEDLRRTALSRIRISGGQGRRDIRRAYGRAKEGLTTDLISRGVLSSGEAGKRYARQAQDVAISRDDLATRLAQLKEDTQGAYNSSTEGLRQDVYQQVANLDTEQQTQEAVNRANTRGARRARGEAQTQYEREQQAREDSNQQLIDLINRLYTPGYGAPATSTTPTSPTIPYPTTRYSPR